MRNVIVTGGSRGLGLGIARKLTGAGFRVIAIARTLSTGLASAMEESERVRPGSFRFLPLDLGDLEALPSAVRALRQEFGPIFGLVNNAGVSAEGLLALMSNSEIERLIRMNTLSPIVLTKYVVRYMTADGGGRIVNVSSITATTGYSGLSVYSATKASLVGFTHSLAREVGRTGVSVNAISPGFIDTDMTRATTTERRDQLVRRSALKRLADVEDVANAVEFLMSDKARSITGTVLTVDAGSTA